ncbi:putative ABC transporter permease [Vagococcus elongatus]|uniref:ABC transporter permease n=1 Tax=Vagococcus elongatus TaxID=180344 RepID=A0A430B180_9ENTE|nr:hypothetical protein [Vagococcus elongatus]RSU14074.1 hypothetical protein CBF29_04105 [Vagococcus elongatus]
MNNLLNEIALLFLFYAIIGWLWETVYCSIKAKKFVYRGFLIGPYCPIYGFGILSVLYFIAPYQNNLLLLYSLSVIVVTVLEYFTSYILEKIFHATWWDYTGVPLNLNGRVALPVSLFWGTACVLIVKVIHPEVMKLTEFTLAHTGSYLYLMIAVLFASDSIYTVFNMINFNKISLEWDSAIDSSRQQFRKRRLQLETSLGKNLESIKSDYAEWREEFEERAKKLPKLNFNHRRYLRSFKNFRMKNIENQAYIKEYLIQKRKERKHD